MPSKKKSKRSTITEPIITETASSLNQSNNTLFVLLIIVALFSLYLFLKVRNLEKKIAAGLQAPAAQGQQVESPLSVNNLKKYAKEIGLNTGKFNKCIDSGEKKKLVDADQAYGSSVGIQGTPGFFVNGRLIAGAFPFEYFKEIIDKEITGNGSENCNDYSETLKKFCQDSQQKPFDPVARKIELGNSPYIGAASPKVNIVEFSDFQCPYCVRVYPTVKKILETYKNDVRVYFKQFPLTQIHPQALKAAEASFCAQDQGLDKFWKMHDKIFSVQAQPGA